MDYQYLGPYTLGPNDQQHRNGIYTGDARKLARHIPDESVDLIFTDPVYDRIEDYRWLAETAVRVLKPNSAALVFCGIGFLPQTCAAMTVVGLSWRWCGVARYAARPQYHGKLQVQTTLSLWYEKGRAKIRRSVADSMILPHERAARYLQASGASWDKHPKQLRYYIDAFSDPDSIVFDPFSGMSTVGAMCKQLGRRYLAFEIDPATAHAARQRVQQTQPPLFVLDEAKQLTLIA